MMLNKWTSRLLAFSLFIFVGSISSFGQVEVVPRQIFVLHGGVDAVWGQLMFMVQNQSDQPSNGQFKIGLPTETVDWQGGEGFDPKMFTLSQSGGVEFTKTFKPGSNIHTMNFKTEAASGQAQLSVPIHFELNELSIMTKDLVIDGSGVEVKKRSGSERFDRYTFRNLKKGSTLMVTVEGIQQGRGSFWVYGWATFGLILILCFGLAYRTKPSLDNS